MHAHVHIIYCSPCGCLPGGLEISSQAKGGSPSGSTLMTQASITSVSMTIFDWMTLTPLSILRYVCHEAQHFSGCNSLIQYGLYQYFILTATFGNRPD